MQFKRLPKSFYSKSTLEIAPDLIGKYLVDSRAKLQRSVRIVEVEAYLGEDDPACHASCGKTVRNAVMYGPPGFAYVYLIYGMYHCLNLVTEPSGYPAAILIRAAEPISDQIQPKIATSIIAGALEKNPKTGKSYIPNGPGKLCLALGVNLQQKGVDLINGGLYVADRIDSGMPSPGSVKIETSPRIGISRGQDKMWRYIDSESKYVSRVSVAKRPGSQSQKL